MLAKEGKYNDCLFHRLVPGFMVGSNQQSLLWCPSDLTPLLFYRYKLVIQQERVQEGSRTGALPSEMNMTCATLPNTMVVVCWLWRTKVPILTGSLLSFRVTSLLLVSHLHSSQWYLTFKATPHLDKKHTVFGKLVGGEDVLDALEGLPIKPGTERPAKPVRITEVVMCVLIFSTYLLPPTNIIHNT